MKVEKSAIIIETGMQVRVRLSRTTKKWLNVHDFVTTYEPSELKFVDA